MTNEFIRVEGLNKRYQKKDFFGNVSKEIIACQDINLVINQGETLALVGESGSGKSTFGKMLLGLDSPTSGDIYLKGQKLSPDRLNDPTYINRMQVIFQDPYSALNPFLSAKEIVAEPLEVIYGRKKALKEAEEILEKVGISVEDMDKVPREFSGGQRQRIGIARAVVTHPEFIVCDEPVSALDVSIQASIINLLLDLQEEQGLTYLFISHDLSVVRTVADHIAVMCKGTIVETGEAEKIYQNPQHLYTKKLLAAVPIVDAEANILDLTIETDRLIDLSGELQEFEVGHWVRK